MAFNNEYYNEEGRKVQAASRFNDLYRDMHVIHTSATGGKIFVGNQSASANLALLQSHGITHVVNTTGTGFGALPCHFPDSLHYHIFPISNFRQHVGSGESKDVNAFVDPMFAFISSALEKGSSVLVHCLAGCHRAGTTGIICLIHFEQLEPQVAIQEAKKRRPAIDPICDFPMFIQHVARAKLKKK